MFALEFSGRIYYDDQWGELDRGQKVVVTARAQLRSGDGLDVSFVVDTGAPWSVLDPRLLEELVAEPVPLNLGQRLRVFVCGAWMEGDLFRLSLTFGATGAAPLEVDATIFVPTIAEGDQWPHPNFLGLSTLDRLRWALEPYERNLYYGPVG